MPVVKVEFFSKNAAQCHGSHKHTLVNGAYKPPSLTTSPGGILKVAGLDFDVTDANTEICVVLQSPCNTPELLFGSEAPWYTLFDTKSGDNCCIIKKA